MEKKSLNAVLNTAKKMFLYHPPQQTKPFVLDEVEEPDSPVAVSTQSSTILANEKNRLEALLRYGKRLSVFCEEVMQELHSKTFSKNKESIKKNLALLEKQWAELSPILLAYKTLDNSGEDNISVNLIENKKNLEKIYKLPLNKDVVIRSFSIQANQSVQAMLVFIDGLSDKKVIHQSVLEPLFYMQNSRKDLSAQSLYTAIETALPNSKVEKIADFSAAQEGVNQGDIVLFIDGFAEALLIETKGWEKRMVGRTLTEQSVHGAQHSFTETLRINTALIRTMLHSSDLVTEMHTVGVRGKNHCAIMYVHSIANCELVEEVRRRIKSIVTDIVVDSGVLDQFITDHPSIPFPQSLSTERPDRIAVHLVEGRVAILMDGSPFVNIVPVDLFSLFHVSDDFNMNLWYGSFIRIIRITGGLIACLMPGMYLAISTYHPEAIPTDLLLSIAGARSKVPFPTLFEIIMLDIAIELVREGGIRMPGILGPTIGIVGALILGQAAVAANLVSQIVVIIVSVSGLASFAIPEYRLASTLRILRFVFVTIALFSGLAGIAAGILLLLAVLSSMKSFGMPYLSPLAPKSKSGPDIISRKLVYQQEHRPDDLNTRDNIRQPPISRLWTRQKPVGGAKK